MNVNLDMFENDPLTIDVLVYILVLNYSLFFSRLPMEKRESSGLNRPSNPERVDAQERIDAIYVDPLETVEGVRRAMMDTVSKIWVLAADKETYGEAERIMNVFKESLERFTRELDNLREGEIMPRKLMRLETGLKKLLPGAVIQMHKKGVDFVLAVEYGPKKRRGPGGPDVIVSTKVDPEDHHPEIINDFYIEDSHDGVAYEGDREIRDAIKRVSAK